MLNYLVYRFSALTFNQNFMTTHQLSELIFHVRRSNLQDGADWLNDRLIPSCATENEVDSSSNHNEDEVIYTGIFSQRRDVMFENLENETGKQCVRYRCDFYDGVT